MSDIKPAEVTTENGDHKEEAQKKKKNASYVAKFQTKDA